MSHIVAVVPIKLGSQRIRRKNLRPIFGRPLVTLIFEKLLQVEGLDDITCFCSSPEIRDYLPEGVTWTPRHAMHDAPEITAERFFQAIGQEIPASTHVVCNATAPFLRIATIQECLNLYMAHGRPSQGPIDSVCTVYNETGRMWTVEGQPVNHDGWTVPRSQDVKPYCKDSEGCWVVDTYLLSQYGRRIGFKPMFVPVHPVEAIDLNTMVDLELMQAVATGLESYGFDPLHPNAQFSSPGLVAEMTQQPRPRPREEDQP